MIIKTYSIIFEDQWIMVVEKPSGMLVIPTPKKETNTLTDLLNRELDRRAVEASAHPCHRLDRETSGLILYAKGKKVQQAMMDEFKNRRVKKKYVAFIQGVPAKEHGVIKKSIFSRNRKRAEPAETRYRVIESRRYFSIVEVEPMTGRTNQIRIHFKSIGHPLVGESVYAFRKDFDLKFRRAALHASALEFIHPVTGKVMRFESPLPSDMAEFLAVKR